MTEIAENDLLSRVLLEQDVDKYLSLLSDGSLDGAFPPQGEIDFSSLLRVKCKWSVPGKVAWIKQWFGDNPGLFPSGITLRFPLWSKYGCHMDDAGNVRFPLPALMKRFDPLVKYVFHESAHLIIARTQGYRDLLTLDKAFLSKCGADKQAICLSPVEYFASRLSVSLLDGAAAYLGETRLAMRLLMQKGVEERKLSRAISAFTASRQ